MLCACDVLGCTYVVYNREHLFSCVRFSSLNGLLRCCATCRRPHAMPHASPALCGVPVILDGVVCPAREDLGDLGPLVAVHAVGAHEDVLLRLRPRVLLDGWVQLIVPSETRNERVMSREMERREGVQLIACNFSPTPPPVSSGATKAFLTAPQGPELANIATTKTEHMPTSRRQIPGKRGVLVGRLG